MLASAGLQDFELGRKWSKVGRLHQLTMRTPPFALSHLGPLQERRLLRGSGTFVWETSEQHGSPLES